MVNTHLTCVCCLSCLAGDLPSAGVVIWIWWTEGQASLRKSVKTLHRTTGILPSDGGLLQTLPLEALGAISESSAPVKTSAFLSKVFWIFSCPLKAKSFWGSIRCSRKPNASVHQPISFWPGKLASSYSCEVSFSMNEQPSCSQHVSWEQDQEETLTIEGRRTQDYTISWSWTWLEQLILRTLNKVLSVGWKQTLQFPTNAFAPWLSFAHTSHRFIFSRPG